MDCRRINVLGPQIPNDPLLNLGKRIQELGVLPPTFMDGPTTAPQQFTPPVPFALGYQEEDRPYTSRPDFSKHKEAAKTYPDTKYKLQTAAKVTRQTDKLVQVTEGSVQFVAEVLGVDPESARKAIKTGDPAAIGIAILYNTPGVGKGVKGIKAAREVRQAVEAANKAKKAQEAASKGAKGSETFKKIDPSEFRDHLAGRGKRKKKQRQRDDELPENPRERIGNNSQNVKDNLFNQNSDGVAKDIATYGSAYFAYLFATGTFDHGLPGNGTWVGTPQQWAEMDEDEKAFARELMRLGLRVGRGSKNQNGRVPDFTVNGKTVELKTVGTYGRTTIKNAIHKSVGQGQYTIIDARGLGYTRGEALTQIKRAHGAIEGGVRGQITVLTDYGPVSF